MCFDVPKVVRSPGYDHGHDEESRNGRDIKIDILEAYIWISELFRVKSGFHRSTGGYRNPPGKLTGLMGHSGEEEAGHGRWHAPRKGVRIGQGKGAAAPLSFLLSTSSFPPSPTPTRKGGVLLPVGVGLPPWRALPGRPPLPPCSFIYGGRGAPLGTTIDLLISYPCAVPPPPYSTLVIS